MDELDLPAFLDRKLNGVTTEQAPRERKPRAPKAPAGAVRVYIANKFRGLSCGWHFATVETAGRKWVSVRFAGKARCVKFPRHVWERIHDTANG